ncbi:hypothetical protein [Piscinibacter sakaiensis]|uniref:hypothetical protein n=1 Tax=Piscinibacter sakaiensis TaxID=1547922 RepID=UPI003AAF1376
MTFVGRVWPSIALGAGAMLIAALAGSVVGDTDDDRGPDPWPNPVAAASHVVDPIARPAVRTDADLAAEPGPDNRLSFSGAPDLYALANEALASARPERLRDGWHAVTACMASVHPRERYEQMANGAASGPASAQQMDAASRLLEKCRGFFDNDRSANDELRSRLRHRAIESDRLQFPWMFNGPPTATRLMVVLEREDWMALNHLAYHLISRILERKNLSIRSPEAVYLNAALEQVSCDLGRDCTSADILYLLNCADQDRCAGSVEQNAVAGMQRAELARVGHWRRELKAAISARDLAWFGY